MGGTALALGLVCALSFFGFVVCGIASLFPWRRFLKAMPASSSPTAGPLLPRMLAVPEAAEAFRQATRLVALATALFLLALTCTYLRGRV